MELEYWEFESSRGVTDRDGRACGSSSRSFSWARVGDFLNGFHCYYQIVLYSYICPIATGQFDAVVIYGKQCLEGQI
jgi:hypothetical protein